jgi:glycosyltransferase involved in cell wall biosynthesis
VTGGWAGDALVDYVGAAWRQPAATLTEPAAPAAASPAAHPGYRPVSAEFAISPSVSVIIPALNEARNLPAVFASLPAWVDEVVLVDGHSADDTVAVARRLWPQIRVVSQRGRGKGDALAAGFAASRGDILVAIDADGSNDGAEIARFVAALVAGADFVKGSRFASGAGSDDLTRTRRYGNSVLCTLVNHLFGTRYTDLRYGYNAFWASHLPALGIDCPGFEIEALMNVRAARAGLRVHEVPSHEHARGHGVSKLNVVRDGLRIAAVIVSEWRSARRPPGARPAALRLPHGRRGSVVSAGRRRQA